MALLFDWWFWGFVVAAYFLLTASPARFRGQVFGCCSVAVIATLGSIPFALCVVLTASAIWFAIKALQSRALAPGFSYLSLLILAVLVVYNIVKDYPGSVFSEAVRSSLFGHRIFQTLLFVGFSYAALRVLDCLRAVKAGAPLLDPVSLMGYLFPFHMLAAGPITLYKDYAVISESSVAVTYGDFVQSVNVITTGLFFKIVIAEGIRILGWGVGGELYTDSIFETAALFVYLFFDFCGYSLVAFGIGLLLGVPTPNNFDRPFVSKNITEFWTRWHISLGEFVRHNIYMPVQVFLVRKYGIKKAGAIAFFTSTVSFSFTGLWHQLTFSFLLWGFFLGFVMGLEKVVRDKLFKIEQVKSLLTDNVTSILGPIYVFVVITCSLHLIINDVL